MLKMYSMSDSKGNIIGYAYGEPWVWQAMLIDDIYYLTKEEAIKAWEEYEKGHNCFNG